MLCLSSVLLPLFSEAEKTCNTIETSDQGWQEQDEAQRNNVQKSDLQFCQTKLNRQKNYFLFFILSDRVLTDRSMVLTDGILSFHQDKQDTIGSQRYIVFSFFLTDSCNFFRRKSGLSD